MKKYIINNLIIILLSLFLLLIFLVLFVDVRYDEVSNQNIGLYFLNQLFRINEYNKTYDLYSDYFLYISLLFVGVVGIVGLGQLVKNKKWRFVDYRIKLFGLMLLIMTVIWIIFDKILIINYRPIKIENEIESSFPSTHLMVVTFVYLSICSFIDLKDKSKSLKIAVLISIIITILITASYRILSGVHWFTDIIGGVLIGILLFLVYIKLIIYVKLKKCKY